MTVVELALKAFVKELLLQTERIEHSASSTYYSVVYVDDIIECAKKYGIEVDNE